MTSSCTTVPFRVVSLLIVFLSMRLEMRAMFATPDLIPLERLLKAAETQVAKNPDSAQAHYTLARVHYLAFHVKHDHLPAFAYKGEKGETPEAAPQWMLSWSVSEQRFKKVNGTMLNEKELTDHATKALHGFDKVLQLDPKNGLAALGRASLLEEFAAWVKSAKPASFPDELKLITTAALRAAYAKALDISLPHDSKLTRQPISGIGSLCSHEAASALIRLAKVDPKSLTDAEILQVRKARAAIAKFEALPMGPSPPLSSP